MRAEKLSVFLTDNATELATMTNVADDLIAINAKVDELNHNDNLATADTTGTTVAKEAESEEMVQSSLKLSAYLQIYARNTNDKELTNLINYGLSELKGADDNKRRNSARFLTEQAEKPGVMAALGAIVPIGYLPADLLAHKTNVTEYDNLIGRPNEKRSIKSAYTKAVARNLAELDDIIANLRIDMAIVKFLNQILFDQFEAAALIDDAPTVGQTNFNGTIDPSGNKKVAEITYDASDELRIENTGTTTMHISFRNEDGTTTYGTPVEVLNGATLILAYNAIAPEGTHVWLQNMSASNPAGYKLNLL